MPDLTFIMRRPEPCRAEVFLRQYCGISHRQLTRAKHTPGGLTVNGRLLRSIDTVHPGDVVHLHLDDVQGLIPNPALTAPAVFSDADVTVYDKPAGMPVHPSQHHRDDTLGNLFAAQHPALTYRPIHRLDQNTSGLVAIAMHPPAALFLPGRLWKEYLALVHGCPPVSGTVEAPIGRVPGSVITRRVAPDGKRAVTHFERIAEGEGFSLLRLRLETGRTHQIRVHMAYIGHPLLGDDLYGGDTARIRRHALHCAVMHYTDSAGCVHEITSPLPEDMQIL